MISDSPYQVGDEILKPLGGILAGLVGGFMMLAFFSLIGFSVDEILKMLGEQFLSWALSSSQSMWIGGLVIFELIACLGGLLYGVSQRSIPNDALLIVGASFGILTWLVDNLFGLFLNESLRAMMRTWQWLVANIIFGFTLALIAVIVKSVSDRPKANAPRH